MYEIDHSLLERIDKLDLSERNKIWREEVRKAPWRVYVDRERWTVESWKETEGLPTDIRWAKALEKRLLECPLLLRDGELPEPHRRVLGEGGIASLCHRRLHMDELGLHRRGAYRRRALR